MKLKKIIALVMALALVIGAFAACGGKTEPDTPTDAAVLLL